MKNKSKNIGNLLWKQISGIESAKPGKILQRAKNAYHYRKKHAGAFAENNTADVKTLLQASKFIKDNILNNGQWNFTGFFRNCWNLQCYKHP